MDDLSPASSSVINWETDEAGISRVRPGLVSQSIDNLGASPVIGAEKWSHYTILVTEDRKLWAIDDLIPGYAAALSDGTSATQLEGTERPVFAFGADHVYVAGGKRLQRWGPSLGLSEVVTASPECTHVAALGGYLVTNSISSTEEYQWSSLGEGTWTTWPGDNVSSADARPDAVVAVYENVNEVFVFGESTLQVYALGVDPTLPFDRVSTINVGLSAPYCVVRLDEQFCFLDDKRRLVMSDGRSVTPISDAIQKDLRGLTSVADGWGYREELGQHSKLVFRFPADERTFVYDLKGQRWSERKYYLAPFQADWPVGSYVYVPASNQHLVGLTGSSGGVAYLDADTRQDLGRPIVCERITGWSNYGVEGRKRSRRLQVVMRRGTAAEGATPGALEVRAQNDGAAWGAWNQISVGTPSEVEQVRHVYAGGVFRRRRCHVRYSNTENISLVSIHDEVDDLEAVQ